MPDFAAWRDDTAARAEAAWGRIQQHPTRITIRRAGETLDAQTVRIGLGSSAREDMDVRRGLNVMPGVQRAVVFGIRSHPTVPDTDMQHGDRFIVGATEYEVIGVVTLPGEVQALCEART